MPYYCPLEKIWSDHAPVHNGLAAYGTWTSIATLVNFGIALKHNVSHVDDPYISSVVLGLILFAISFWFLMEIFIFEKYVRYTVTIYPVTVVASVGIFLGVDETAEFSDNEMMNAQRLTRQVHSPSDASERGRNLQRCGRVTKVTH
ncbi:unnamed protein product [Ranitomeya imitator]|uniref:Uncharacterized protein n=1 Tax=Ranitomeya imitator TaxID=111125 RepID=A0ABN9LE82_9NEOB|nr:unnamed protein product [Ranitomeya imitator]